MVIIGERAPRPIVGHSARSYRQYALKRLQRFSDDYRDIDPSKLPPDAFALADKRIRADAIRIGSDTAEQQRFFGAQAGSLLREVRKQDQTGRWISEFVGPVDAINGALAPFRTPPLRVRRINRNPETASWD